MTNEERAKKNREYVKRWKAANPEKVREQHRRYHKKHRTERLLYLQKYHQAIRDKAKKYDELKKEEE
jgi:hypothetical protein